MKAFFAKITLAILILIGFLWLIRILLRESSNEVKIILNPGRIPVKEFVIHADDDTIITGEKGTVLKIDRGTFKDCLGKPVNGQVEIRLKEIYSKSDHVLSGLTTTSDGKILETGGMLYLNAYQKGKVLCISDSAKIGIIVPAGKIQQGMKLYKGRFFDKTATVNWIEPEDLLNPSDYPEQLTLQESYNTDEITEMEAISRGYLSADTVAYTSNQFWSDYADGLYDAYTINSELNYVFETNDLGWLNVDRMIDITATREIRLLASIHRREDFNFPVVKLIFKNLEIYLDGFEAGNNRFVFGKNYSEHVHLPVGEPVILLAVAQHKGKPYLGMQEFILGDNPTSILNLQETTMDEIESLVTERF